MINVAALTSYSMAPLHTKLRELVWRGINTIDLYCFCPQDLPIICDKTTTGTWPEVLLESLHPPKAAQKITNILHRLEKGRPGRPVDICGFASFLPDISLPSQFSPEGKRREITVKVLERLLELLMELKKRGFSCRTFELVAGHTIVQPGDAPRFGKTRLRYVDPNACFKALEESLKELAKTMDRIFQQKDSRRRSCRPVLAFEIEPGVSKLNNGKKSLAKLWSLMKRFPDAGLNLDIGHMLILGISPEDLFGSELADRIAHVHISDNADSHFADLCVGTYHKEKAFAQWIRALANHFRKRRGAFQGCVSIEMEACGSADMVRDAVRITKKLVREESPR